MNLEYTKRLFVWIFNRRLYNCFLKSSYGCNIRYIRLYSQHNAKLVDDNSLRKIINLSEFVEERHCSVLKKINSVLQEGDISKFSQEQKNLLFYSCGKLLSNRSLELRRRLCEEVFDKINCSGSLTIIDCNTYIQTCTENEKEINFGEFFKKIPIEGSEEMYKLLLENACEMGNVEMAYDILAEMKNHDYTIDERIFNALMLANTTKSGWRGSESVLSAMKTAHILDTSNTNWNMLKGFASRSDKQELLNALSKASLSFDDGHFMQLLLKLGLNDGQHCLPQLKQKLKIDVIPCNLTRIFDHLCIHLIHRAKAKAALELYCSLCELNSDTRFLLEDIVKTDFNSNQTIIEICEYLKANGKNQQAFEDFYDISLRFGKYSLSLALLGKLEHLRPHYFWPLIVKAAEQHGEMGVLDILVQMRSMNVEIDLDTLELYALPHCDLSNSKALLERLEILGLPLKLVLTPILTLLLNENKVIEAHHLCNEFKVDLWGDRLVRVLANTWVGTKDSKRCVNILKRMSETNKSSVNVVGSVLMHISKLISTNKDYKHFYFLLKDISVERLLITPEMSEGIRRILHNKGNCDFLTKIEEELDNLVDMSVTGHSNLHPKDMTLHELECHLTELQNKNMETRGVLRKLIQLYAKEGNHTKISACLHIIKESKYELSPGIKASLLQSYMKIGDLSKALDTFQDLRKAHPHFNIDHYKVIDLASLLVKSNEFEKAMEFLKEELRAGFVRDTSLIERNCWKLLSSCANPIQTLQIFQLLTERGYCKPTNVILGPIVRAYLKEKDHDGAINFYVQCSNEHKCTPLQLELIFAAIDMQDESKLRVIIDATANVHGVQNAQMALLAALAEKGLVVALNKMILGMKSVPQHLLQLRCKRWVKEGKVDALIALDKATYRLPPNVLDAELIYTFIGQIYVNNNDCEGAARYCQDLVEREITTPKKLAEELGRLFTRNKFKIPDGLVSVIRN